MNVTIKVSNKLLAYILVIPLVHQVGLVSQQVNIPVESFKVTNEGVVDMARSALFEEGSPVFIIISDVLVHQEINKLIEPGILEAWSSDLLSPVVHHNSPAILVVIILVECSASDGGILKFVSESTQDPLKRMPDKDDCFASASELRIHVPGWKISKLFPRQHISLTIQNLD